MTINRCVVHELQASAFTVPTDAPESDGTLEWDSTTIVVVEARAADEAGLGYSYTSAAAAALVSELLVDTVIGRDAMDVPGAWLAMTRAIRNLGRPASPPPPSLPSTWPSGISKLDCSGCH